VGGKKVFAGFAVFVVVVCGGCGRLLVADDGFKSRRCPHCGFKVWLSKARVVGTAASSRDAVALVQQLKQKRDKPAA
jgi:LSD1 subclass zinc finger protein